MSRSELAAGKFLGQVTSLPVIKAFDTDFSCIYNLFMSEVRAMAEIMIQTCACLNLRKADRALTQFYDGFLRSTGIRSTQLPILTTLASAGPQNISQLAKLTVMDQSTLTRKLKLLKEKKLIRVRPGKDKRVREVILTDRGAKLILKANPLWEEAQSRIANELGQDRLQQLLSVSLATINATRTK